jgi:hypothetical protein
MKNKNISINRKPFFYPIIIGIFLLLLAIFVKKRAGNTNKNYIYKEDFLHQEDYAQLLDELKLYDERLAASKENMPNLIRYNLVIDNNSSTSMNPITQLLKKYEREIRGFTHNSAIYLAHNFPIEYRKYVPGSFMKKHKDTLIYKIPQYECVLTLSNTTDSVTNMEATPLKAKPNSLIIVKALGIEHEVTPVTKGERKFLKFIFTATDERAALTPTQSDNYA